MLKLTKEQKLKIELDLMKDLYVRFCAAEYHELRNVVRDNSQRDAIKFFKRNESDIYSLCEELASRFVECSSFIDEDDAVDVSKLTPLDLAKAEHVPGVKSEIGSFEL